MNDPAVTLTVTDRVATVTLNSPANRNALSPALIDGLGDALDDAIIDRRSRGHRPHPHRPGVLRRRRPEGQRPRPGHAGTPSPTFWPPSPTAPNRSSPGWPATPWPAGWGWWRPVTCRWPADNVRFGFTEVRIGVAPAIISVVCLPKLRRGDAAELFLTGERIPAGPGRRAVGLINRCVARRRARRRPSTPGSPALVAGGPLALAAAKRLIAEVPALDRATAFTPHRRVVNRAVRVRRRPPRGWRRGREKRPAAWIPRPDCRHSGGQERPDDLGQPVGVGQQRQMTVIVEVERPPR